MVKSLYIKESHRNVRAISKITLTILLNNIWKLIDFFLNLLLTLVFKVEMVQLTRDKLYNF